MLFDAGKCLPRKPGKVGVEGSDPFARSNFHSRKSERYEMAAARRPSSFLAWCPHGVHQSGNGRQPSGLGRPPFIIEVRGLTHSAVRVFYDITIVYRGDRV